MPCYDSRSDGAHQVEEARKEWRHNSPVAEMLCEALRAIELAYPAMCIEWMSKDIRWWWKEHQERDKQKEGK